MKKLIFVTVFLILGFIVAGSPGFAQEDRKGCADPPLFTRVPGFYLNDCKRTEFDGYTFVDPATKKEVRIEGRWYFYQYMVRKDAKGQKSMLQIARNYSAAIEKIGGFFLMSNPAGSGRTWMKLAKDGREIWVALDQDNWKGGAYYLYIVEKEQMKQEVAADAKFMADGIRSAGHVAVYGIYFDFNRWDVKPESTPALSEIARLLSSNPSLNIFIVGHTDNVGSVDYNMKLSQARADAVVKALTTRYRVSPQRLKAYGLGQLAPAAPNTTEEGRARNRRVELVEQ